MANSPYIFDATPDNFRTLVLENSEKGPVLVHYWSPRAGPCMLLMPRLTRLANEYSGKFLLVMLNTDEHAKLAREFGVTSVPTVKFFRQGQVRHTIHGAEPDAEFRQAIDKFVARQADMAQAIALRAYHQEGNVDKACTLLAKAALDDPTNFRISIDLAKLLMLKGDFTQAEYLLQSLPGEIRDEAEVSTLLAHAGFVRVAQDAPDIATLEHKIAAEPDNTVARYQLSALRLVGDDYAGAMDQLLEIVRRDRGFRDDAGRKGMIAIFNIAGGQSDLVGHYRSLLADAMH